MSKSSNISRVEPVGNLQDRLSRRFELEAKYLADNAQCEPVKVLFGRDTLSMTQLLPVFDIKTKKGGSSKGKSAGAANVTYFGGLAIAYCVGKVFSIYKIWNGDDLIQSFTGPRGFILGENGADWNPDQKYNALSIPKYGDLRIYQGRPDQLVDSRFWDYDNNQAKEILIDGSQKPDARVLDGPWSAYPNLFYIVSDLFRLGSSNTTPNIRIELQVIPTTFATEMGSPGQYANDWASISADLKINGIPVFDSQGDTYAPLVIYEYLRNSTWGGAGLFADAIDKESFLDALAVCIKEEIAISPCVDENSSVRNAVSALLEYIDGVIYLTNDGKIALKCVRTPEDLTNIQEIDEDSLVDEPHIEWSGSEDTWGRTIVSFNSRVDDYESTSTGFDSPRYIDYKLEEIKVKEVDLPYIKQRIIASRAARRIGNAGATPGCEVELAVLPSLATEYHVGDLIKLSYEKFGIENLLLRINSITLGTPTAPSAIITAVNQVETDWNIEIDLDSLESGFPSKTTGAVEVPGGFLKPYVLGMFGNPDRSGKSTLKPNQGVVFVERADEVKAYTMEGYEGGAPRIDDFETRWTHYQVKVKIRDWGVSSNPQWENGQSFLWVEFEAEGNARKELLESVFESRTAYITTCAYKNPTFPENILNTTRTLLPMTFSVLEVNYEGNGYYENGYSVVPTIDPQTGNFVYKLKVFCAANISGTLFPDTVSRDKYYPAQTAFVYVHYESNDDMAWFVGPTNRRYVLSGKKSYIRANAILADGRKEEKGGFFRQFIKSSRYYHQIGVGINDPTDQEGGDEYEDAWGLPVRNSDGEIQIGKFGSSTVQPAAEDETPQLFIDDERGIIFDLEDGQETIIHQFETFNPPVLASQIIELPEHNHDDRYQKIGESAERYYIYRENSDTFEHESGQCGLLHIHLPNETAINITLPSAETAECGDIIEVVCTKMAGVEQNTVTLTTAQDESFFYSQSSIIIGVGITVYLICTQQDGQNIWFPDIQPKLNYS